MLVYHFHISPVTLVYINYVYAHSKHQWNDIDNEVASVFAHLHNNLFTVSVYAVYATHILKGIRQWQSLNRKIL